MWSIPSTAGSRCFTISAQRPRPQVLPSEPEVPLVRFAVDCVLRRGLGAGVQRRAGRARHDSSGQVADQGARGRGLPLLSCAALRYGWSYDAALESAAVHADVLELLEHHLSSDGTAAATR